MLLDLHANPSPELVAGCDALVSYDTYPHVDVYERADELIEHPEAEGPVGVFEFAGQETSEGLAPELQHMQGPNPVPGDS